jgi:RhtB (resistance to homoserine/threonine) family protein
MLGDAAPGVWAAEFAVIVVAHALAVASPGPDFAMVVRQSLRHGRTAAVWTSVGIGSGIFVHVGYSLFGAGLLLREHALALGAVRYLGAAYLAWVGVQALRSRPVGGPLPEGGVADPAPAPGHVRAWMSGFLTNVLNPKATLFFLALMPNAVSPSTPVWVQGAYGLWMALATAGWFSLVSTVFTRPSAQQAFRRRAHWIDRALGVVFLGFAASLVVGF